MKSKFEKELKKVTYEKVVIDRNLWLRADKNHEVFNSCLYNGKRSCCLGLIGHHFKIPKEEMLFVSLPDILKLSLKKQTPKFIKKKKISEFFNLFVSRRSGLNKKITCKMAKINDDHKTTDEYKEQELYKLGKKLKLELMFIN